MGVLLKVIIEIKIRWMIPIIVCHFIIWVSPEVLIEKSKSWSPSFCAMPLQKIHISSKILVIHCHYHRSPIRKSWWQKIKISGRIPIIVCYSLPNKSYQKVITKNPNQAFTENPNQWQDQYHCLRIIVCHYHYTTLVQQGSIRISKYRKCRLIRPKVMNEKDFSFLTITWPSSYLIRFQTTSA